jgi:hypothetical protein
MVPIDIREEPASTPRREALAGETERVANSGADETADESTFTG